MNLKGINYDTGIPTTHNIFSRETFNPPLVQREIEIIKNDLHCNAIRISGQRLERLLLAAEIALGQGLDVWFSPSLAHQTQPEALDVVAERARCGQGVARISFSTGVRNWSRTEHLYARFSRGRNSHAPHGVWITSNSGAGLGLFR